MNTPIINALKNHVEKRPKTFHVPGHKSGLINPLEKLDVDSNFLNFDLTEVNGLDDLHSPEEAILESERLLSEVYGSKKSFLLVNGSTVGNLAMIMATVKPNSKVIIQRNCHKSVLNAIKLLNAFPIFLPEVISPELGIAVGPDTKLLDDLLSEDEAYSAIVLTYPNYYGCTYDIKDIVSLAHSRKIPVLVDEAHGAHFVVGSPFPKSALELGADVVVHSAHKTLPAMTMGSFLHFNSDLVSLKKVTELLTMLQSSSPSYPIMASLDFSRDYVQNFNKLDAEWTCKKINEFCDQLSKISKLLVIKTDDPLKLVLRSTDCESGYSLQSKLEDVGIFTELADVRNVLLVMPLLKHGVDYDLNTVADLIKGSLEVTCNIQRISQDIIVVSEQISTLEFTYSEMDSMEETVISIYDSVGKVSSETIIPYPPGIPVILRGERITKQSLEKLLAVVRLNGKIQGYENIKNGEISIFK